MTKFFQTAPGQTPGRGFHGLGTCWALGAEYWDGLRDIAFLLGEELEAVLRPASGAALGTGLGNHC
jgi:hypothetical protein